MTQGSPDLDLQSPAERRGFAATLPRAASSAVLDTPIGSLVLLAELNETLHGDVARDERGPH